MTSGTTTATHADTAADTAARVLVEVRASRAAADREEARLLRLAVDWAAMHSVDSIQDAACFAKVCSGDRPFPVAGPGAPMVAEFCVAEFAAAMRLPTEVGTVQLGEAVELRYRLPRLWTRATAGDLQPWRARRIARETICLSMEAAGFVDAQVAGFAHRIGPAQVDRLVTEAVARFMPEEAARRRRAAADGRHVNVYTGQVSFEGTIWVEAELDLADGLDLDTALAVRAAQLSALGSVESLDVRRSVALGDLARTQLALDLATEDSDPETEPGAPRPARPVRKPRQVVLYVHLSEAAIRSNDSDCDSLLHLGRVENTRSFVSAEQVREWCGHRDAQLVVKPVIDLAEHIQVGAYEVPDRLAEQATLVDLTRRFPFVAGACARYPARSRVTS